MTVGNTDTFGYGQTIKTKFRSLIITKLNNSKLANVGSLSV
jgi:hypothetical protein